LRASSNCRENFSMWPPMDGMLLRNVLRSARRRVTVSPVMIRFRYEDRAPTLGEIDISLSLRIMIRSSLRSPAQFKPSRAIPADMEPSPMTTTIL